MKELIRYTLLFIPFLLLSCNSNEKSTTTTAEKNPEKSNTNCSTVPVKNTHDFKISDKYLYIRQDLRNKTGMISVQTPTSKKWRHLPGKDFIDFDVSNAGNLVAVKSNGTLFKLKENKWEKLPGNNFKEIAFDENEGLYAVKNEGSGSKIYRLDQNEWTLVKTSANINNITILNGEIYGQRLQKTNANHLVKIANNKNVTISKNNVMDYDLDGTNFCLIEKKNGKNILKCMTNDKWQRVKSVKSEKLELFENRYYTLISRKSGTKTIKHCAF